jgi:hypothetical protein
MCAADNVWTTELTLILGQFVTRMRRFIGQSDIKQIMTSPIKRITSVPRTLTDIITNTPARHIRLAEISEIMSVSTFKITVILYRLIKVNNLRKTNIPYIGT